MHALLVNLSRATRWLVAAAAAALLIFSFFWVATRPLRDKRRQAGQITLSVIHWGDKNEDAIMDKLCKDFEAQNPDVLLKRSNLGQAVAVNTKLQTMYAAGDPPDVFYLGYEKVADMASKDLLADIDELIAQDRAAGRETLDLDDFFPNVLKCFQFDPQTQRLGRGKLIALPKDFTPVGFYYNKDLFRRAGVPLPPNDDWTWDEFIETARAIAKLPGCYGADFVTWEPQVRIFAWTHGENLMSPDFSEHYFEKPALQDVFRKLQGWFHDEKRTLVSAKTQIETLMEPFLAGNVGLAGPFGRWKCPTYWLIEDFDWDFAPLPHAKGHPPRNGIFTTGWAIAKSTPRKDAAWRFVKYLGGKRGQTLMCSAGLAIPTLRSVAHSPAFNDPSRKPHNVQAFLAAAEYAEPIDWPADPKYLHQLRVRMEDVFKLGKPVKTAMRRVAQEWSANDREAQRERSYRPMPWSLIVWGLGAATAIALAAGFARWWRNRPRGLAMEEELAGNLMVSPWVIGFAMFTAIPILLSLLLAFTKWSGMMTLDHAKLLWLHNFRALWESDTAFRKSIVVTCWYTLLAVPSAQLAALVAAMLMNHEYKGIGVFRAIWYLPSVLAGVGLAVMWKWAFHHEHGLFKMLLDPILPWGLHTPAWFEKDAQAWAVPAFAILNLWSIGGTMMIYLAGLKGIPKDLYEAADIDGAIGWRQFVHVTLPMLSPVILFNVIIALIASFQVFTQAFVMTGGGPGDESRFYVVALYNQAFDFHNMGYASAMAWLLLVIVLTLTLILMKSTKRFVYYEGLKQ